LGRKYRALFFLTKAISHTYHLFIFDLYYLSWNYMK